MKNFKELLSKYTRDTLVAGTNYDVIIDEVSLEKTADGGYAQILRIEFNIPESNSSGFHQIFFRDSLTSLIYWNKALVPDVQLIDLKLVARKENLDDEQTQELRNNYMLYLVENIISTKGKDFVFHFNTNSYVDKNGNTRNGFNWIPYPVEPKVATKTTNVNNPFELKL